MKTVLIVDDSAFIRDIHREIIETGGFRVIEAANGENALAQYDTHRPDAVLMDLLMPDMDGMDVIEKIMAGDPSAITIVCSTDKQKYRRKEGELIGARAFLPKPVDSEELLETLKRLIPA